MEKNRWLRIICFVFMVWLHPEDSCSQESKRDNIWMICGYWIPRAGIDFNAGYADTFSVQRDMDFFLTNASICDTTGQLLLYTNGHLVSNNYHDTLANSFDFNPGHYTNNYFPYGNGALQGALILPVPNHTSVFVIFHESADTFFAHGEYFERPLNLSYSIADLSLNSGNGAITKKNIHIIDDTLVVGRISGCKHANGRDWWVIKRKLFKNEFIKVLVTPDTIIKYGEQAIGTHTKFEDALGVGIFNSDGSKYVNLNYDTTIDILDFDRCTGQFSNLLTLTCPDSIYTLGGCAFSASGRFLYVSTNYHIFQFDTWASDISTSRISVSTWDGVPDTNGFMTAFFAMRLAPDNKIYVTTNWGTNQLHVIDYPDSLGIGCNVRQHGLILPSFTALGLPNAINYSLGGISGSACDTVYYLNIDPHINEEKDFLVFPNPSNGIVNVRSPIGNIRDFRIWVFDELGLSKEVSIVQNTIDLSYLNPGIYLLKVFYKNNFITTNKIILLQ